MWNSDAVGLCGIFCIFMYDLGTINCHPVNEYLPTHPEYSWIKEVSSKAVKHAIECGCTAFTRFFKHQSGFPNFKKKDISDVKMYFVKNNPKDCFCERHRIHIPTLGWVRLKEKGYLPTTKDGWRIRSGAVSNHLSKAVASQKFYEFREKLMMKCHMEGLVVDVKPTVFAMRTAKYFNLWTMLWRA